jgi:DNA-binding transcriptional MerR regulator
VRYYERIGLLSAVPRVLGQRCYDDTLIKRLSLIHRARTLGFTLDEIRRLFEGFPAQTPPPERWQELAQSRVAELQQMIDSLTQTQEAVRRLARCRCTSLEMCGERMRQRIPRPVATTDAPWSFRMRRTVKS